MEFRKRKLLSEFDGLELEIETAEPAGEPKAAVQLTHGMAEHKERYEPFMRFLAEEGYVAVIHDHRGHGASVQSEDDYGYFYTEDISATVEDLRQVTDMIRKDYPGIPVYMFSHSMGTLVARSFLRKYDALIEKLVLCGPPTKNSMAGAGYILAKIISKISGPAGHSRFLDSLAVGVFNKGFEGENQWLSVNSENVSDYNEDPLSGFMFTNNGYVNLMKLMKESFRKDGWAMNNPDLPVLLIAGEDDPVIQSRDKFMALKSFLETVGYKNTEAMLFSGMRHEILNEHENRKVYDAVAGFFRG